MKNPDPVQPPDAEARALAQSLITTATYGALGVLSPDTGAPSVTRIAIATAADGGVISLVSGLAGHTPALMTDNRCSLLLGEPGPKGNPLTHPRLTLDCRAFFVEHSSPQHHTLRDHYLTIRPKAKLYIDLPDFRFLRFELRGGLLNGGFGKAYRLQPEDL